MNQSRFEKYRDRLATTPPAGEGNGFHSYLLGTANVAVEARVGVDQFVIDMLSINHRRHVSRREIIDAFNKASGDQRSGFVLPPQPDPVVAHRTNVREELIRQGRGADEANLTKASPIRLDWPHEEDTIRFLSHLYQPDELLFIGDNHDPGRPGQTIRPVRRWERYFRASGKNFPHIIPNPLTGRPGSKKTGDGETYRGDSNVRSFAICTVEFDDLSREDQLSFWSAVDLPISALVDTGGKSIHCWLDVRQLASVSNLVEWNKHIKHRLYDQILIPLGVDRACSNPARLSRLPGHYRQEKQKWQRILYLSPEGRKVF